MARGSGTTAQNRSTVAAGPPKTVTRNLSITLHVAIVGATVYPSDRAASDVESDASAISETEAHLPTSTPAPRASFPVKLDVRMTLESLKDTGLSLYSNHCLDSGVAFDPPSLHGADYDIFYSSPEGVVRNELPLLVPSAVGGANLRSQLLTSGPAPPIHLVMVAGRLWTQRHGLELEERALRRSLHDHREAVLSRWKTFSGISQRRAQQVSRNRERHMVLVGEIEAALFGAVAAMNVRALESQKIGAKLEKAKQQWAGVERQREAAATALEAEKRKFFANSANSAAVDGAAALRSTA